MLMIQKNFNLCLTTIEIYLKFKAKITDTPVIVSVFCCFDEISDFKQQLEYMKMVKIDALYHFSWKVFTFYQFPLSICDCAQSQM